MRAKRDWQLYAGLTAAAGIVVSGAFLAGRHSRGAAEASQPEASQAAASDTAAPHEAAEGAAIERLDRDVRDLLARVAALERRPAQLAVLDAKGAAAPLKTLRVGEIEAERIVLNHADEKKRDEDGYSRFTTLDEYGIECFGGRDGEIGPSRYAVLRPGYLQVYTETMKRQASLDAGWNGRHTLQFFNAGDTVLEIGVGKNGKALVKAEE